MPFQLDLGSATEGAQPLDLTQAFGDAVQLDLGGGGGGESQSFEVPRLARAFRFEKRRGHVAGIWASATVTRWHRRTPLASVPPRSRVGV